jgi:hypothetical protein
MRWLPAGICPAGLRIEVAVLGDDELSDDGTRVDSVAVGPKVLKTIGSLGSYRTTSSSTIAITGSIDPPTRLIEVSPIPAARAGGGY